MSNATILIVGFFSSAIALLMIAGLLYYLRRSLQIRAAVGPGWDFDRDEQPIRYWLQLAVVAYFVVDQVVRVVIGIVALWKFI